MQIITDQHSVLKQMIQLFNSTIKFKAHCEYIFGEPSVFSDILGWIRVSLDCFHL